jgi:Resolvase, N terminal domain
MRVAIYARFSSDLQDVRSITDQVAAARDHAAKQGWQVIAEFCDAAISGASLHNWLEERSVAAHWSSSMQHDIGVSRYCSATHMHESARSECDLLSSIRTQA